MPEILCMNPVHTYSTQHFEHFNQFNVKQRWWFSSKNYNFHAILIHKLRAVVHGAHVGQLIWLACLSFALRVSHVRLYTCISETRKAYNALIGFWRSLFMPCKVINWDTRANVHGKRVPKLRCTRKGSLAIRSKCSWCCKKAAIRWSESLGRNIWSEKLAHTCK